jgi:hypothetical protein
MEDALLVTLLDFHFPWLENTLIVFQIVQFPFAQYQHLHSGVVPFPLKVFDLLQPVLK